MTVSTLHALVSDLDRTGQAPGWHTRPVTGGANGLIYYARNKSLEVAVKFYSVDTYDRVGREYDALRVLQAANPPLAPRPLLCERQLCSQPVTVQSWLSGEVSATPPRSDEDWAKLLGHYVALARVRPDGSRPNLKRTVLNASTFEEAKELVQNQFTRLPRDGYREGLEDLVQRLFACTGPTWPRPSDALCRGDSNLSNFVRRQEGWCSLDWEYGGWGDPAFEIAELMTHPAYADVPDDRWPWVVRRYSEWTRDDGTPERIRAYGVALSVWWTVRFARYLYEVPRGLDQRLVAFPDDFLSRSERQFERYHGLAARHLEAL